MSTLKDYKKSTIDVANTAAVEIAARSARSNRVMLSRGAFTDEQLESAGSSGSVNIGRATYYDFCRTRDNCTTYTTTCPGISPGLTP